MAVEASFRVMGASLDPTEVSDVLGIEPDLAHRSGDPVGTVFSRSRTTFKGGLWALKSTVSDGEPLEQHLTDIISRLGDVGDAIRKLKWRGNRVDFFVGVFANDENVGMQLSNDVLSAIARLSADLTFDFYSAS